MEFIDAISHTIGNIKSQEYDFTSDSEYSDEEFTESTVESNQFVICLLHRTATWVFMPCRHATCCTKYSQTIEELGQPCPICRTIIESRFQIFTN